MSVHARRSLIALVASTVCSAGMAADTSPDAPAPPLVSGPTSDVRVNQVGYLPHGPKAATLLTASITPMPFELRNARGVAVLHGESVARSEPDRSSGLLVHELDFSAFTRSGNGYTIVAAGHRSYPFSISPGIYQQLRVDAASYYYPVRSGIAVKEHIRPGYGRPAGHVSAPADGTINRGDRAVPCQSLANQTTPQGTNVYGANTGPWLCPEGFTLDVHGGWYDAGDHGKYVVNGGISVAQLMITHERSKTAATAHAHALEDGTLPIPESGNRVPDLLDEARWQLEWMLRMQVPQGTAPFTVGATQVDLSGMAFHKVHDEGWTGLPLMPHLDAQVRSLHRPSRAATLNLAAAAAQGARLFAPYDEAFATRLLEAARRAYAAAKTVTPTLNAPGADGSNGGGAYNDFNSNDELYWAAAELYLTTGEDYFRDEVMASTVHTGNVFSTNGFSWNSLGAIARMDLATVPNALPDRERVRASVLAGADAILAVQAAQPWGQAYNPNNWAWGSNSQILNNLVVLGTAFDISGDERYRSAVIESMDYILGRNAMNNSYVTGYGEQFSKNQHSRWFARQLDPSLPHPPQGAISGGPNSTHSDPVSLANLAGCVHQRCYIDDIESWSTNEITINWNAPLTWVAAFLADQFDPRPLPAPACTVQFAMTPDETGGRFEGSLQLTNTSGESIRGVEVEFAFNAGQRLTWIKGSRIHEDDCDAGRELLESSRRVRDGDSLTWQFRGVNPLGLANPVPELVTLNGEACAVL